MKKKDFEACILREVRKDAITLPESLRKEIMYSLEQMYVYTESEFTIGYIKSECKLTTCSSADIEEV